MGNKEKAPVILDFGGDALEAVKKLESILYTSGWNHYLIIDRDVPSENELLLSLVLEKAIVVGEVYYTFTYDFTDDLKKKAYEYFHRLRKRDMDSIYLNAVNYFSNHEPDIEKTDNGALFYPEINAYVRCGDLSPVKMFELLMKDGCERVIIFGNGLLYDNEQPWEVFHSFEMCAPKEYITKRLAKLQDDKAEAIRRAFEKAGINDIIPNIPFPPTDEWNNLC